MLATLVIGLVPALRATSSELNEQIKSGQHTTQAQERNRWLPRVLMSVEVALALVLVVGAGLLASSLVRLYRSGEGFDPRGVENVAFSMDKSGMDHDGVMNFYRDVGDGLSHVPGVRSVSFALVIPFNQRVWDEDFAAARTQPAHDVDLNAVGPDYFQADADSDAGGSRLSLERHQRYRAEDHPEPDGGQAAVPAGRPAGSHRCTRATAPPRLRFLTR